MKRALVRLYVVGSILFFLGITVFFFVRLAQIRDANEDQAAIAFRSLSDIVATAWREDVLPEAGNRVNTLLDTDAFQPLVVSVYSFDVGIDYLWAVDDRFIVGDPGSSTPTPPIITTNELVHVRYSRSFALPNGERRIVTAVYPVLSEAAVFPVLRTSLIIILAFLSVVLLVAIAHVVGGPAASTAASTPTAGSAATESASPPDSTDQPETEASPSQPAGSAETAVRGGDASTDVGLSDAASLPRRLALELERAAYQEQDLSVALFSFSEGKHDAELYRRNAEAILSFFTFDDLCFESGDREIAVIFPGTTLSDALGQIERFQRYYWEERLNWGEPDADFTAGVSARNGRLVEADRVLGETRAALHRAPSVPGRIMGFQPDPQRYRAFLVNQSR